MLPRGSVWRVSYRDDLSAAQSRIEALERELAGTKAELETSKALVVAKRGSLARRGKESAAERWLGGPTRLDGERVVDGEVEETDYRDIVDHLSDVFGVPGRLSTVPGRLEWTTLTPQQGIGPQVVMTVTSADGKTVIRGHHRLGNVAGGIFGGLGGGAGLGGAFFPGLLFMVNPIVGAIGMGAWLGGFYFGCRRLFKRSVKKRSRRLEEALDGIAELVEAAVAKRESEQAREAEHE